MATINKEISHVQGIAPKDTFTINDDQDVAIDIIADGWSAEIKVRRGFNPSAPVIATFSTANTKLEFNTSITGQVDFNFDGTEFDSETIKGYKKAFRYDFEMTDGAGITYTITSGDWILISNI